MKLSIVNSDNSEQVSIPNYNPDWSDYELRLSFYLALKKRDRYNEEHNIIIYDQGVNWKYKNKYYTGP